MPKPTEIKFNLKGLSEFQKQMGDDYRARVGILGSHAVRTEPGSTIDNATLGVIQMFGSITKNIPPRDFLFFPVQSHNREIIRTLSGSTEVKKSMAAGDYKKVYALLGAAALEWVQKAFETSGFGQWPPNKPATIRRKKSDRPLIDHGELRRAQTFDVVKKSDIK